MARGRPTVASSLGNLARHPTYRWRLAAEALLTLVFVKLMLLTRPFKSYRKEFGDSSTARWGSLTRESLAELVWAVDRLSRFAPRRLNCMPRALATQRMMRRRGAQGVIRFGVKLSPQGLAAHAWLVLDDEIVIGALPQLEEYKPLPEWPTGT